jgi:hypothetical protein
MSQTKTTLTRILLAGFVGTLCTVALAAYKARPWSPRARDSYRAVQTSQGVTLAIEPLFRDNLASQVFDKDDIVTRGIMPVAVVVFNDNDFPVEINGASIELVLGKDHGLTLYPEQFIPVLFKKSASKFGALSPLPRGTRPDSTTADAMEDFDHKFLASKNVAPHGTGGGFLYFRVPQSPTLPEQLSSATLYVPEITRIDKNTKLMYFEIDLQPAIATPK